MEPIIRRDGSRVHLSSPELLTVYAITPTIRGCRTDIHDMIHDGDGIAARVNAQQLDSSSLFIPSGARQPYCRAIRLRTSNVTVTACVRIGLDSPVLPLNQGRDEHQHFSDRAARCMTVSLFVSSALLPRLTDQLHDTINGAVSRALGYRHREWFRPSGCGERETVSGLVICSPGRGVPVSDIGELCLTSRQAATNALAAALCQYYQHIS